MSVVYDDVEYKLTFTLLYCADKSICKCKDTFLSLKSIWSLRDKKVSLHLPNSHTIINIDVLMTYAS